MITQFATPRGTVEVRTERGKSWICIEHEGDGLAWTLYANELQLDEMALHMKAIADAVQSIADGDLEVGR